MAARVAVLGCDMCDMSFRVKGASNPGALFNAALRGDGWFLFS